jgi:hypothetical protein
MLEATREGSPKGSAATIGNDSGAVDWVNTTRDACSWALVGAGAGELNGARGTRAEQLGPEQGRPGSPGNEFKGAN